MIRQFAVEYAHKIQTAEIPNVVSPSEPDGPLDLTLSRNTNCAQQGKGLLINLLVFSKIL